MVFGILASAITSLAAFAFPVFASYKAIKANDNTQLAPWLMFWSVQACLLFCEHWFYFLLQWVPLYKEGKMFFTLWMVLPQTQGATYLYLHYLHPLMSEHERDLDQLVSQLHRQLKNRGGQYIESTISWLYSILFGPTTQLAAAYMNRDNGQAADAGAPASSEGYVAALLSRFRTLPIGGYADGMPASLLSFLSSSGKTHGEIIPSNLSPEERTRYVAQQKAKLQEWLHMLDAAAQSYPTGQAHSRNPSPTSSRRPSGRSVSGMELRSPSSGSRTPTANDSDYEDLGKEDAIRATTPVRPVPQTKGSWFWKTRTD